MRQGRSKICPFVKFKIFHYKGFSLNRRGRATRVLRRSHSRAVGGRTRYADQRTGFITLLLCTGRTSVNAWPGPDPRLLDPAAYAASPNRLRFAALCAYFSRVGEVADIRYCPPRHRHAFRTLEYCVESCDVEYSITICHSQLSGVSGDVRAVTAVYPRHRV